MKATTKRVREKGSRASFFCSLGTKSADKCNICIQFGLKLFPPYFFPLATTTKVSSFFDLNWNPWKKVSKWLFQLFQKEKFIKRSGFLPPPTSGLRPGTNLAGNRSKNLVFVEKRRKQRTEQKLEVNGKESQGIGPKITLLEKEIDWERYCLGPTNKETF